MRPVSVNVPVPRNSYPVIIGPGSLQHLKKFLKSHSPTSVCLISDKSLVDLRTQVFESIKSLGIPVFELPVSSGETLKSIENIFPIYGELIKTGLKRSGLIVALGGGTIGDAAGFVAASYQRGVPWVGIPTTLLAQVDSSVGGKTGINHPEGKNMIGAFHQPKLVICDLDFLKSLGEREIQSGLAEAVKYAITFDSKLFSFFETNIENIFQMDSKALTKVVSQSVKWKAKMVARDERDEKGIREILNFGHTFGHALEKETHFSIYQHGEAIVWGMRFALQLSLQLGICNQKTHDQVLELLSLWTPPPLPKMEIQDILSHMKKDKKVRDSEFRFVLLKKIGMTKIVDKVNERFLVAAWKSLLESQ